MMRRIAVLDAPSNLGLRPPTATSVPGCAKAPGALRDQDLLGRLGARDAGCLTPPRYDPGDWRPGDGVSHADQIGGYSVALAERIGSIMDQGEFPVVLGGDCSILLGAALAMHRLGEAVGGRIGLVYVDGHSDFRHPGNASYVGAAAGEGLALVTGRGQADLAAIEGRRPYFRDIDVVVLGIRAQDEYRLDLQAAGIVTRPAPPLRAEGAARSAQWAHDQLADCAGYWVHVDVDVLDPAVMPAVDAPDAGGIAFPELELLLAGLVDTPHCLGVEITVFDPDYDPEGYYAAEIVDMLAAGLAPVSAPVRPPAPAQAGPPPGVVPPVIPSPGVVPDRAGGPGASPERNPIPVPSLVVAAERGLGRLRSPLDSDGARSPLGADGVGRDDEVRESRMPDDRVSEEQLPVGPAAEAQTFDSSVSSTAEARGPAVRRPEQAGPDGHRREHGVLDSRWPEIEMPAARRRRPEAHRADVQRLEPDGTVGHPADLVGPSSSAGPGRLRRAPSGPDAFTAPSAPDPSSAPDALPGAGAEEALGDRDGGVSA